MLPGAGKNKELLSQVNDKDLDRATAIVQSMTPEERRNPKIVNGSRRARIAGGSGVTPGQVGALIQNFLEGQKQMKQMLGGGLGNVPGLPPGMRRAATKAGNKKQKSKRKHPGGDPRRAAAKAAQANAGNGNGNGDVPGNGRAGGLGGPGGLPEGFTNQDMAETLAALQKGGGLPGGLGGALPGLGTPDSNIPAAFRGNTKRNKKKK
jgi:signal recognition particle subunit SRP54